MQQQYDIGKRLREVMAERGVTISQLAELTDVSEDTIKAIRSGKTKSPGIQLMISIADALGCTMDGFLHRRSLTDEELYLLQKYRTLNTRDRIYRDTRRLFSKCRLLSEAHDQYAPSYLY
jgi:predicted transcriptional regulators